jgi:hypothetical protein
MTPASPGALPIVTQCLAGFGFGVGAGVLAFFSYGFLSPGAHDRFGMAMGLALLWAAYVFPIFGIILGGIAGIIRARGGRCRGLWLGAALGAVMGLGWTALLAQGERPHISPIGAFEYYVGDLFLAALGAALGAILGNMLRRRRTGGT